VITFDPFGGYGHPDHIKMHHATLAAFEAMQSEAVHPQKLYYPSLGRRMLQFYVTILRGDWSEPGKAR